MNTEDQKMFERLVEKFKVSKNAKEEFEQFISELTDKTYSRGYRDGSDAEAYSNSVSYSGE